MKISVNGIELFYKKSGQGYPIILLHGSGQDHRIFNTMTKKLSGNYTVYAIDSRDHGQSSKVESLDYRSKMEDVAEFIRKLDIDKPILFGFSDGGIIGLLLAIKHPKMLCTLIISGANTNPDGIKKSFFTLMKLGHLLTGSKRLNLMMTQPNITKDELNAIVTPTLVLAGRHDIIKDDHTRYIAANIPGSELQILKGEGHSSYVTDSSKLFEIIKEFVIKKG